MALRRTQLNFEAEELTRKEQKPKHKSVWADVMGDPKVPAETKEKLRKKFSGKDHPKMPETRADFLKMAEGVVREGLDPTSKALWNALQHLKDSYELYPDRGVRIGRGNLDMRISEAKMLERRGYAVIVKKSHGSFAIAQEDRMYKAIRDLEDQRGESYDEDTTTAALDSERGKNGIEDKAKSKVIKRAALRYKATQKGESVDSDVSIDEAAYLKYGDKLGPKAALDAAVKTVDAVKHYLKKKHPSLVRECDKAHNALRKAITWLKYKEEAAQPRVVTSEGANKLRSAINGLEGVYQALMQAGYESSAEMVEQAKLHLSVILGRMRGGIAGVKRAHEDENLDEAALGRLYKDALKKGMTGDEFLASMREKGRGYSYNPDHLQIARRLDGDKSTKVSTFRKNYESSDQPDDSEHHLIESIASTILQQLGGNKFKAMTGAKNLYSTGKGLQFDVGRNAKKVSRVVIELDPSDTYTMKFYKGKGLKIKLLKELDMIYADQLQEIFKNETGLDTRL